MKKALIPKYAYVPLLICFVGQFVTFYLTRLVPRPPYIYIATPFDASIPLRPEWIYIYVLAYLFWALGGVVISRHGYMRCMKMCVADVMCKIICAAFFLFLPTRYPRPEAPDSGIGAWLTGVIFALDEPDNIFPSMHCYLSWLIARELGGIKEIKPAVRLSAFVFAILVCLSTLFTKQHVISDAIAGVLLYEIVRPFSRLIAKRKFAKREKFYETV